MHAAFTPSRSQITGAAVLLAMVHRLTILPLRGWAAGLRAQSPCVHLYSEAEAACRCAPYAIAYDIGNDRERSLVDKILRGFGMRVQKSVFECRLTRRQAAKLSAQIEQLRLHTGFVLMYRLFDAGEPRAFGDRPHSFACDDDAAFVS